jgi:Tol biopolymer transport system component
MHRLPAMTIIRKWWPLAILFLSLFYKSAPGIARGTFSVQKVSFIQYQFGRGVDMLAKPAIQWTGNPEVLVLDGKTSVFWKKKKIQQIMFGEDEAISPCRLFYSPDGNTFLCTGEDGTAGLGETSTMEVRPLREKLRSEKILWRRDNALFYHLRNGVLCSFDLSRSYSDPIAERASDFYLSCDDKRIIVKEGRSEEKESPSYSLLNAEGHSRVSLPKGGIFIEPRTGSPFITNLSADFRRIIYDRQGPQGKGFVLSRVDWKNILSDSKVILDDYRGNQDAVFSPDMTKIALTGRDGSGRSTMIVVTAAGDIVFKSSPGNRWIFRSPLWSPQNDLLLWNYIDSSKPEHDRNRFVITDPRGVSLQFLPGGLSASEIYWSPRGDFIVMREVEKSFQPGRYIAFDIKGKKARDIFKDAKSRATSRPVWSPDGHYVAIVDYSNFQKREKKTEIINGVPRDSEIVFFREQIFLYKPLEDVLQLIW